MHRVLVVDDNQAAAEMLSLVVRSLGNEVRTCYDGPQALEAAEQFLPDIVLLDIGMPGMDGYEVARRIREQPWGEHITLVAVTGWGQEEDRRRTKEVGFDHHLVKPASPVVLERILAHHQDQPG
ncbi:MAG: response regulator [Planctomycetota bacterium]